MRETMMTSNLNEETLTKLALDVGLINYIDCETPRRYFIDGRAELPEVVEFAKGILWTALDIVREQQNNIHGNQARWDAYEGGYDAALENVVFELEQAMRSLSQNKETPPK